MISTIADVDLIGTGTQDQAWSGRLRSSSVTVGMVEVDGALRLRLPGSIVVSEACICHVVRKAFPAGGASRYNATSEGLPSQADRAECLVCFVRLPISDWVRMAARFGRLVYPVRMILVSVNGQSTSISRLALLARSAKTDGV